MTPVIHIPERPSWKRSYLVIVDDREDATIPYGGLYILGDKERGYTINEWRGTEERKTSRLSKRILYHLPLNNSPILTEVPLLSKLEKKYFHIPTGKIYKLNGAGGMLREDGSTNVSLPLWLRNGSSDFIDLSCTSPQTKKYSEEDIDKLLSYYTDEAPVSYLKRDYKKYLQLLSQPKLPIGFKFETQTDWQPSTKIIMEAFGDNPKDFPYKQKITTIPNEQGIPVAQGTWVYEK